MPGAAEDLVASVGHVDILIANHARPFAFTPAQEGTDEEMERLMSSIFYPMHRMIKAVLPQMLARRSGKIVVTSSVNAIKGRAGGATLYSAAREAQIAYMRHLAHEVAPHMNVNATAQTYVDNPTYFSEEYKKTEDFRRRMAAVPAGRRGPGRVCPSPLPGQWVAHTADVTGPRGPGVQSTLMPVSGAPVRAEPSVKRVVACQKAAVPR